MDIKILPDLNQVTASLNKKYQNSFYFFTAKFINQLIYSIGTPLSICYQDLRIYYDDIEYLRRTYRNRTLDGKPEIQDRIKVVAKYYKENQMLTYQVPMMFITKTKDLYLRRQKRLKKLNQKDQSSSSQNKTSSFGGAGSLSFSLQQDFLRQLHVNLSDLMNSEQASFDINDQIDSQCHDIFQNLDQQFLEQQSSQIIKIDNVDSISHLICDFQDVDKEAAINFLKEIKKSKNSSSLINQILEQEHKFSGRNSSKYFKQNSLHLAQLPIKSNKLSSKNDSRQSFLHHQNHKNNVLGEYMSIFGSKLQNKQNKPKVRYTSKDNYLNKDMFQDKIIINQKSQNQYFQIYKKINCKNRQNAQEQIELTKQQMSKNRKKIRQKAQKLLQKIKKQSSSID